MTQWSDHFTTHRWAGWPLSEPRERPEMTESHLRQNPDVLLLLTCQTLDQRKDSYLMSGRWYCITIPLKFTMSDQWAKCWWCFLILWRSIKLKMLTPINILTTFNQMNTLSICWVYNKAEEVVRAFRNSRTACLPLQSVDLLCDSCPVTNGGKVSPQTGKGTFFSAD